jgi:hypothetical protein
VAQQRFEPGVSEHKSRVLPLHQRALTVGLVAIKGFVCGGDHSCSQKFAECDLILNLLTWICDLQIIIFGYVYVVMFVCGCLQIHVL